MAVVDFAELFVVLYKYEKNFLRLGGQVTYISFVNNIYMGSVPVDMATNKVRYTILYIHDITWIKL